ncbi:TolC family protein [Sandaracinobacteroides saxicola]|uniref:TolC family protein n=1 Tax=Sandaracinobacteroides saxicola TaxID=2759707 RepID=A0A7G5IIW1_9SPHN|nr:TolC family protein [Sandaracinobacteroides saxicola]QMW23303.1 TolC family protein [Sandaracinobacteroides saxicola]
MPVSTLPRFLALATLLLIAPALAAQATRTVTLADIDSAVLTGNIDIRSADNAVSRARAGIRAADVAPNPTLTLQAFSISPKRWGLERFRDSADVTARLDQLIETGGKRRLRVENATATLSAASGDLADTQRLRIADAEAAFFALAAAQDRVAALEAVATSYAQAVAIGEKRLAAGAAAGLDLERQRVDLTRAQGQLATARNDLRDARLSLAILIGAEQDILVAAPAWPDTAVTPPPADADALVESRPDVIAARARVDAARAALGLARAQRARDVDVGLQAENDPRGVGSSFGVAVAIPLLWGNRYSGSIAQAGTDVAQAEALLEKSRAVARAEIATADRAVAETAARLNAAQNQELPAAASAARIAEFAFSRGALGLLDLLDARRSRLAAELDTIDARLAFAQALAFRRAATTADAQPQDNR